MSGPAKSITHEHLLSIVNTEADRFPRDSSVCLLDVGCGDGELLSYLAANLQLLDHSLNFDMYGFDVEDYGI
jgi:2-polyprenyl-3-methyl-5-hydroxy-6-metoxy-1,4-benzoquinol methylase